MTKPTDQWVTPRWVVDGLMAFAVSRGVERTRIIDVCASDDNYRFTPYITTADDTLVTPWGQNSTCWMNPPYSNPMPFIEKAVLEMDNGNSTIALLKNDCSTKWFSYAVKHASDIVFITDGRVGFDPPPGQVVTSGNNFSSVAFVFNAQGGDQYQRRTHYLPISQLRVLGGAA